jgi:hypothetical protein
MLRGLQKLGCYILEFLGRFAAAFFLMAKSRHREKLKISKWSDFGAFLIARSDFKNMV